MKNIAFLVPNLHSGGSERIAAGLSKAMSEKYNVFTVVFDPGNISYEYGGKLINLNLPSAKGKIGKVLNIVKRIFAFRRFVKKEKIDVCCSFTSAADYVNAFSKAKCKRLVSCRGTAFLKENMGLYKKMCGASDGILFNSEGMKEIYLEKYPEDAQKAFVLYNLFDIARIRQKAEELPEPEVAEFLKNHRTVTAVGRFVTEKGQWNLIKAFELLKEKIPDSGLLFVGHMGALEADIKKMAEKSEYAADIAFTGYSDNPFKYCKNSAVFALSSINEGFPNSLVEAMASGVPVVSTDCETGPREILFKNKPQRLDTETFTIGDYGVITPNFTQSSPNLEHLDKDWTHKVFADALELVMTDSELAGRLVMTAAEKAETLDRFSMVQQYEKLFETI